MARVVHARGSIALVGGDVDQIATDALNSLRTATFARTEMPFHVTLITKSELQSIPAANGKNIVLQEVDTRHVLPLGIGANAKAGIHFVAVLWSAGQTFRKRLGLPPKHFHVTLSKSDDHVMEKGLDSLLHGQFPSEPSSELFDSLIFTLQIFGDHGRARNFAVDYCQAYGISERGFVRLGDTALQLRQQKLAMLSFACAYKRTNSAAVREYCIKRMVISSSETEWGCLFLEHEAATIPDTIFQELVEPWDADLRSRINETKITPTFQTEPRDRLYIPSTTKALAYKLPRFFRWLVPFQLAVMSTPRHADDIEALASPQLGIRHVLTLTEETPLNREWFMGKKVENTYLPVSNYHPPSLEQMDLILRLLQDERNRPLVVHCGGGKGRAGTVAACYLVAYGFQSPQDGLTCPTMSSVEAIDAIRAIRPGSIETSQQEQFVGKFASLIWKRQSVLPELVAEPSPCAPLLEGSIRECDLVMLVGLPGSGKSWFSSALLARNPQGWTHISQDITGSRSSCESSIGYDPGKRKVLLDRCNPSAEDRIKWLKLAQWANHPICVHFDYEADLCTSRAQNRAGHPTLTPGSRVRNAVAHMQGLYDKPSMGEGFKAIVTIRSFEASRQLVSTLSPPLSLFKFPRTTHLLNLGAASEDDVVATDLPINLAVGSRVIITEKVDGANLGFSLSADRSILVQNRSHYVNPSSHEQFKKLGLWIEDHRTGLYEILDQDVHFPERYVLFGEWLAATHSIPYSNLTDLFLAFDLYDRSTGTWADRSTICNLLKPTSIQMVPLISEIHGTMPSEQELKNLVQQESKFYDGRVEGIYVKVENQGRVASRGKVVRSDFIAGNDHWTKGILRLNNLHIVS